MDFSVSVVKLHAQWLGFDAISTYALPGGTDDGLPMSELSRSAQSWWEEAVAAKVPFVPIAPPGGTRVPASTIPAPASTKAPRTSFRPLAQRWPGW